MIILWPHRQASSANYPAVSDVRDLVVFGGGTGTLEVPVEADVREGTEYDGGRLGTLALTRESVTVEITEDETVTVITGET